MFITGLSEESDTTFLTIYADDNTVGSLELDGVPVDSALFSPIHLSGYSVARVGVAPGMHTTEAGARGRHSVVVHEYDDAGFAYAYLAGYHFQGFSCLINVPGDVNESGSITSADVIRMVGYVFKGGTAPSPCAANGDVNCSGGVNSADIIYLVNFVFKGQSAPCDVCQYSPMECVP